MSKFICLALFFNLIHEVKSQVEFAPIGAEWTDQFVNVWPEISYNELKYKSTRDTLIEGKKIRVISSTNIKNPNHNLYNNIFLYQDGFKLFTYMNQTFLLIFDFEAKVHDTINTYYTKTVVEDITIENIQGLPYKRFKVTTVCRVPNNFVVHELFGGLRHGSLFFSVTDCTLDLPFAYLKCYSHPSLGTFNFDEIPCDSTRVISNVLNPIQDNLKIHIVPNPFFDKIEINIPNLIEPLDAKIINLQGKLIHSQKLNQQKNYISLEQLQSGVYFFNIFNKGHLVKSEKLVKQ